jgi:Tol biopolymer transport system component
VSADTLVPAAPEDTTPITGYPEGSWINYTSWSPDGKYITFTTRSPGETTPCYRGQGLPFAGWL